MQFVINAVDGDAAGAVEAGDKSVTAGFMGADLFALSVKTVDFSIFLRLDMLVPPTIRYIYMYYPVFRESAV